ncbi:MAG: hypothetical protein JKY37_02400 [Nannocystaceae bacterium]|nr:hypothetical protein [Nannocystaceae bacterium]
MDAELLELRRTIAKLPKVGRRRAYTADIRGRIVAFVAREVAAGRSEAAACNAVGMHQATVSEWNGGRKKRASAKKKSAPRARVVEVVAAKPAASSPPAPSPLSLLFPAGVRVDGLTIADVAAFAKAVR